MYFQGTQFNPSHCPARLRSQGPASRQEGLELFTEKPYAPPQTWTEMSPRLCFPGCSDLHLLDMLTPTERKRQGYIHELIVTEENYVNDLQLVTEVMAAVGAGGSGGHWRAGWRGGGAL